VRSSWGRQVFFRGSRSEGNGRLHVLRFQDRKSGENFFDGITSSQTGQYRAKSVTRVPRKTGSPPQIFVSLTILSSCFTGGYPFPKLLGGFLNEHQ
jgi:hypothetical protein